MSAAMREEALEDDGPALHIFASPPLAMPLLAPVVRFEATFDVGKTKKRSGCVA